LRYTSGEFDIPMDQFVETGFLTKKIINSLRGLELDHIENLNEVVEDTMRRKKIKKESSKSCSFVMKCVERTEE